MTITAVPPIHPAAGLLPSMSAEEYAALRDSILLHGQQEPCVLLDGALLDGLHRWKACGELGITPRVRQYADECGGPVQFVIAMNLNRRHLNPSQCAAVTADAETLLDALAAEAKARQREAGIRGNITRHQAPVPPDREEPTEPPTKRETVAQAAALTGAKRSTVYKAKKVKAKAPELHERVKAGDLSLDRAAREVAKREADQADALLNDATGAEAERAALHAVTVYKRAIKAVAGDLLPLTPAIIADHIAGADHDEARYVRAKLDTWFDQLDAERARPVRLLEKGA